MSHSPWLAAGDHRFSVDQLKSGAFIHSFTGQEKNALSFCHAWLNDHPAFTFQTSGSTGQPKKISFNKNQLTASALLTQRALNLEAGMNAFICLDVNFIAGAMMLVRSMVTGMNMTVVPPSSNPLKSPSSAFDFASFVPLQMTSMLKSDFQKLNSIGKILIGGAPVHSELIQDLQNLNVAVYASYGMTETITHIALQKLNGSNRQDYFQLLPGIHGQSDNRGCLVIQAGHLDKEVITNDIIEWHGDNKFKWIGRADLIINSGGIKIQIERVEEIVEDIFKELNIPKGFFIAGIPDRDLGQKLVLITEGDIGSTLTGTLKTKLELRLPKLEIPKQILNAEKFILTSTQKIDRAATLAQFLK